MGVNYIINYFFSTTHTYLIPISYFPFPKPQSRPQPAFSWQLLTSLTIIGIYKVISSQK